MDQLLESHNKQFVWNNPLNNPLNNTTNSITNTVDQVLQKKWINIELLEKYNLQETDFKIPTDGWVEKKDNHWKKYLENLEWDVWEIEVNWKKFQLFTWEAAMRETKNKWESIPLAFDLADIDISNPNLKENLWLNVWQLYFLWWRYPQVWRCKNITYWTWSSNETKNASPIIWLNTAISIWFTPNNTIVLNEHPLDTIWLPVRCIRW